jgi:hypothetical protein
MSLFRTAAPSLLQQGSQFSAGSVTVSASTREVLRCARYTAETLVARHTSRDYGEIDQSTRESNEMNIARQGYVTSIYSIPRFPMGMANEQVWVTTYLCENWTYIYLRHETSNIF